MTISDMNVRRCAKVKHSIIITGVVFEVVCKLKYNNRIDYHGECQKKLTRKRHRGPNDFQMPIPRYNFFCCCLLLSTQFKLTNPFDIEKTY